MTTYGKYRFSEIFPKTFSYLRYYVPAKYPEYLEKELPDPKVVLKDKPGLFRAVPKEHLGIISTKRLVCFLII